ncbi:hypothetical protein Efla_007587 [Eimeria flavescens]
MLLPLAAAIGRQQQQQRQQLLLRLLQQRNLKYLPFHGRNKKPKKVPSPPPVFAVDALAFTPNASLLPDQQQQQQELQQQQLLQLTPFQAVHVLQAFLPLQLQQADANSRAAANSQQQHQQEGRDATEDPAAAAAAAPAAEHAEEGGPTNQSAADPLVYLKLKVRADLKRESVRGVCTLQHGVGSRTRLAVFCPDEEAAALLALGADFAGGDALIQRIAKGWVGFDKAISSPAMMPRLLKIARVLGPRRLMPSPKSGTVVVDLAETVKAIKSGQSVEFRAEGDGEIRVPVGRADFTREQLLENCRCLITEVLKARPRIRSGGAEGGGSSNQQFQWPPPAFVSRRLRRLKGEDEEKTVSSVEGMEATGKEEDFFISDAALSAEGTPEVRLLPKALHPANTGNKSAARGGGPNLGDPLGSSALHAFSAAPFSLAASPSFVSEGLFERHQRAAGRGGPPGAPLAARGRRSEGCYAHKEQTGALLPLTAEDRYAGRSEGVSLSARPSASPPHQPEIMRAAAAPLLGLFAYKERQRESVKAMQAALDKAGNRGIFGKLMGRMTDDPETADALAMAALATKLHDWNVQNQREPGKTKLIIAMRHAESKFNVWRRESFTKLRFRDMIRRDWGESDVPLSPRGREQCVRANRKLAFLLSTLRKLESQNPHVQKPFCIDAFLVSPLTRSIHTAANSLHGINWRCSDSPSPDQAGSTPSDSSQEAASLVFLVDSLLREKISTMGDVGTERSLLRKRIAELYQQGELLPAAFDFSLIPEATPWWVPHTEAQLQALLQLANAQRPCTNCYSDTASTAASDAGEGQQESAFLALGPQGEAARKRQLSAAEAAVKGAFEAVERAAREPAAMGRRVAEWEAVSSRLPLYQTVPREGNELLLLRARLLLAILCRAKEANSFFIVSHSLFLKTLTGDSKLSNAELRAYTLRCTDASPKLEPL